MLSDRSGPPRPQFVPVVPLMSVPEAATYARVNEATIRRAIEAGKLRAGRAATDDEATKARVVLRQADVDEWLFGPPPAPEPPVLEAVKPLRRRRPESPLQLPMVEPVPVDPRGRGRRKTS
jgi:hypothetical protein